MRIAAGLTLSRKILRYGMPKRIGLALLLTTSMGWMVQPDMALAQSYQISTVKVEGNDKVDPETIASYAGIGPGKSVSAAELNDAYQRIKNTGLFESVDLVPSGGKLTIRVKEYPTINIVNFEGNKRLKDEKLAGIISSKSRRVYSPAQAEADAALITDIYQQEGRLAATVTPRIIRRSGNRVDLAFEIKEGKLVEVERLSFVGNRAFSDRRLRQVLDTKQAGIFRQLVTRDTFVADRLEFDKQLLRDFYQSRGYVDFQVLDAVGEVTRERDGFFVTFTVREGQSFKFGKVSTVSEVDGIDAEEFRKMVKLRTGTTYSPSVIETNIARLENLALQKGLNFVSIEPRITRNERAQTLDIAFAITRGPRVFVERIDIQGNTTTLDKVIRRQFTTVEGDPFNPREVRRAAERIRALGFFKEANVDTKQGSAPDQVIVNVDVQEQPTGSLSFGASYGADVGVGLTAGFKETNFLGRGQTIGVSIDGASSSQSGSFTFVEPAFLGRDLSFSFSAEYARTSSQNSYYDTQLAAVSAGIGFPISENGTLSLNYRIAESRIFNVDSSSSQILRDEAALGGLLSSSLGYSYSYDTRNSSLNPKTGFLLRFGQDIAGLGGDLKYVQTDALALAERRILNDDVTLRAVFEGGMINMINGNSRVTERFFGNSKIRGFEANGIGPRDLSSTNQDALGGNMYATARFETEFPIGLPEEYSIRGGAFVDFGSVWGLDNTNGGATGTNTVDDSFSLRSSIGVSLFWDTPIGPLRFNLSRAIKKQSYDKERKFDLTISSQF
tara:strand:+ start:2572 stop:4923 length:2352 start_codon:yes stop_codon:yes gene_type:complete